MAYGAWHVWASRVADPSAELLELLRSLADDADRWDGASCWIYHELLLDCVVWSSNAKACRSLHDELHGVDETQRIGEDYDLWLRATRVTPILRVPKSLALYLQHDANVTRAVPKASFRGEVIAQALRRWGYDSPDDRVAFLAVVARVLARSWSDFTRVQLVAGDFAVALRAALRAVRMDVGSLLGWSVMVKSTLITMFQPAALAD